HHHVESILDAAAESLRVSERPDHRLELDEGSRPPVREHEGKRGGTAASLVDEMDAVAADGGHELRQPVQPGLHRTPVVLAAPVVGHPSETRGAPPVPPPRAGGPPGPPHPPQPLPEVV